MELLLRITPERYPLLKGAAIDVPVLTLTLVISLLTGFLFGLAPVLASSRTSLPHNALKEGGRGSGETIYRSRLRSVLVTAEFALALLLPGNQTYASE